MQQRNTVSLNVLIHGLPEQLRGQLAEALCGQGGNGALMRQQGPVTARDLSRNQVDIIFCSSDQESCLPVLQQVRQAKRQIPVVVVSEEPEFDQWLDAMEAGASDYCAAPFNREHLGWMLASYVSASQLAA